MRVAGLITIACAAIICAALVIFPGRVCFKDGENYTFYCGTSSADCREVRSALNAEVDRLFLSDVCGESAEYKNFDLDAYLKAVNGKVLFTEELSDSVNYYCSADLPYSVDINGYTVNLHICMRKNSVKVASPIIFGGY